MNHPIVRIYSSVDQANAAVARLRDWGFEGELINLVTASSKPAANAPASAASDDPVLSSIMSGYVLKAHAKVYAAAVHRGAALVSIRPPFGRGNVAEFLLDEGGHAVSRGVEDDGDRLQPWDDSAPLSSSLMLPVLVKATAPFSAFWVLPVITRKGGTACSALGLSELADSKSFTFGSPALSRAAAPLSSSVGLPLLLK
jgi:hypothetical protein